MTDDSPGSVAVEEQPELDVAGNLAVELAAVQTVVAAINDDYLGSEAAGVQIGPDVVENLMADLVFVKALTAANFVAVADVLLSAAENYWAHT